MSQILLPLLCWLGSCETDKLSLEAGSVEIPLGEDRVVVPVTMVGVSEPFLDYFAVGFQWDPAVLTLIDVKTPEGMEQLPFNSWGEGPALGTGRVLHLTSAQIQPIYTPVDGRAVLFSLEFQAQAQIDTTVSIIDRATVSEKTWYYTQFQYCGRVMTFLPQDGRPLVAGHIDFVGSELTFVRGDVDANGDVNLADAIGILRTLFLGEPTPPCADAADANDDGAISITDAVAVVRHLFQGGDSLPPPYPGAGVDPTSDPLVCSSR